jgi:hypothetical protein
VQPSPTHQEQLPDPETCSTSDTALKSQAATTALSPDPETSAPCVLKSQAATVSSDAVLVNVAGTKYSVGK